MEEQPKLDSWDDFAGDFLKAEDVKTFPLEIAVIDVESNYREGKPKLIVVFDYKGRNRKLTINKTNQNFLKSKGLIPKGLIGKKLSFEKVKVRNPTTNAIVDSFVVSKVE